MERWEQCTVVKFLKTPVMWQPSVLQSPRPPTVKTKSVTAQNHAFLIRKKNPTSIKPTHPNHASQDCHFPLLPNSTSKLLGLSFEMLFLFSARFQPFKHGGHLKIFSYLFHEIFN